MKLFSQPSRGTVCSAICSALKYWYTPIRDDNAKTIPPFLKGHALLLCNCELLLHRPMQEDTLLRPDRKNQDENKALTTSLSHLRQIDQHSWG